MTSPVTYPSVTVDKTECDSCDKVKSSCDVRRVHSVELFGELREVLIEHAGFTYRLNITQANKLILTK